MVDTENILIWLIRDPRNIKGTTLVIFFPFENIYINLRDNIYIYLNPFSRLNHLKTDLYF
jgi:hypothetical protein